MPLDIDVDQLYFYNRSENKINASIFYAEDHVISLNPNILHKQFPERFKTETAAKQIITRWKRLNLNDNDEAMVDGCRVKQTRYTFHTKGGKPSYCLHKRNATAAHIIAALQKIHGVDTIKLLQKLQKPRA